MIHLEVEIKGEPDVAPFIKVLEFNDNDDIIFLNSIQMVKDKLSRNLKLNTHETLLIFCGYIVSEIRSRSSEIQIEDNSTGLLTRDNVLLGVPETLREITFTADIDNLPKKKIRIVQPIPILNYIMTDSVVIDNQLQK